MTTDNPARKLMQLAMPPFEQFLEHCAALRNECEKAEALNDERAKLFDEYKAALISARPEYEADIEKFISEQFTAEEIDQLITFFDGPLHKLVEKSLSLSPLVSNIGTGWTTRVLESCPDVWQMLVQDVGAWQDKNTPKGSKVMLPSLPGGWNPVEKPAEELVLPDASAEEAELAKMRDEAPPAA